MILISLFIDIDWLLRNFPTIVRKFQELTLLDDEQLGPADLGGLEEEEELCEELMTRMEVVHTHDVDLQELTHLEQEVPYNNIIKNQTTNGLLQAEDLLEWSDNLDFENYVSNWLSLGTSGRLKDEHLLLEEANAAERLMEQQLAQDMAPSSINIPFAP